MKNRSEKHRDVQSLRAELGNAYNVFVASFEKLTVAQDFELRKAVRGAGGNYKVVKNNLAEKAAEGTQAEALLKGLKGMSSLVYTTQDPVALAKALTAYAKTVPTFKFKAGMVEGRVIDVAAIADLANMPSREEVFAKLLYMINSSAQRTVAAINGVGRNIAVVLDQAGKENKFQS